MLTLLSACEMKDELLGKDGNTSTPTGALELSLSDLTTKAVTRADISTDNFSVDITATDGKVENNRHFDTFAEMRLHEGDTFGTVRLPEGTYSVTAQSPGTLEEIMDAPYYRGNTATDLVIEKDITAQTEVTCKRMNTQVTLNFGENFLTNFPTWAITLDDGSQHIYTYNSEQRSSEQNAFTFYWYISEAQATTITLNITATNGDGQSITHIQRFTKPSGDTNYFTGGDALNINLMVENDLPTVDGSLDFKITVDISFDERNETVEIPVEDVPTTPEEPENPGEGEDNPGEGTDEYITMQMPQNGHITYSLSDDNQPQPASANVVINATQGLKSVNVKISAGNEGFEAVMNDLPTYGLDFITTGVEMVDNTIIGEVLGAFGAGNISTPQKEDKEFIFAIDSFFGLLNNYGATTSHAHVFSITVEDMEGHKTEGSLSITITE